MQTWPLLSVLPPPTQFKPEFELLGRPEPYICGLYVLWAAGVPVYVGQSTNIVGRLQDHRKSSKRFDTATWYPVADYSTRLQLEGVLILATLPTYNRALFIGLGDGRCWEIAHRAPGTKAPRTAARTELKGQTKATTALLCAEARVDKRAKRLRKANP